MPYSAEHYEQLRERSEREDIVMFINTCFAATGQNEYYNDRYTDSVSIDFLHQYVLANYRTVYARVLSVGINHFSQALIIRNLLQSGAPTDHASRIEEGRLIEVSLRQLPANRVFKLFARLRTDSINNRRTRAVVREYLRHQQSKSFFFVKYRNKLRTAVRHAHADVSGETARFLFSLKESKQFQDPLYDAFLRAHFSKQAVFELPFTVAEGLAARHGIRRDEFLRKIGPMMTRTEKLRLQNAANRTNKVAMEFDLSAAPLTGLALYILSLPLEQRKQRAEEYHAALFAAANRVAQRSSLKAEKTAAVMDRSRSTWGTRERRRRPLAIAVAMHYLLSSVSAEFRSFWSPAHGDKPSEYSPHEYAFLVDAGGQTDLATPLLNAIAWRPNEIVIVSDGYENSPTGAVNQIVCAYRERLQTKHPISFIHTNPVFDAEHFSPKRLGDAVLTIGLRDAEDLSASMRFAKFAAGEATQAELETFLSHSAETYIGLASNRESPVASSETDQNEA
ncbi:MAG: hypothetical protein KDB03_04645 [Planctomycetales bacterium]|nr:hypothetical protein [Planctomycetales bacterium]